MGSTGSTGRMKEICFKIGVIWANGDDCWAGGQRCWGEEIETVWSKENIGMISGGGIIKHIISRYNNKSEIVATSSVMTIWSKYLNFNRKKKIKKKKLEKSWQKNYSTQGKLKGSNRWYKGMTKFKNIRTYCCTYSILKHLYYGQFFQKR